MLTGAPSPRTGCLWGDEVPRSVTVTISFLGPFRARVDDVALPPPDSRKAVELLAFLLLNRQRPHHRDGLAELLWPESGRSQARRYLRQCLWQLHSALAPVADTLGAPLVVARDAEWIAAQLKPGLAVDVDRLEQVAGSLQPGSKPPCRELREACDLYRGPFLDGRCDRWVTLERERYQALYFRAANLLMQRESERGNWLEARNLGHRCLRFDLAHEPTHRLLMAISLRCGDRVAALRQYGACCDALDAELGAEPEAETRQLYDRIRTDGDPGGGDSELRALDSSASRLDEMRRQLGEMQREISALRQKLDG